MRILLVGDEVTDCKRERNLAWELERGMGYSYFYGTGYAFYIKCDLCEKHPAEHEIFNRGYAGDSVCYMYGRIKQDCWSLNPDLVSIQIGINDIRFEFLNNDGTEIERFEKFYRMYLSDVKSKLPNAQFILVEPFVLRGYETKERFEDYQIVREYAKLVKKLAKEFNAPFVAIQDTFDEWTRKYGDDYISYDGINLTATGARLLADAWLNEFYKKWKIEKCL